MIIFRVGLKIYSHRSRNASSRAIQAVEDCNRPEAQTTQPPYLAWMSQSRPSGRR